jgi:hypothetical protein
VRNLALFNLAIDSKLRGCDLVALRVNDVAPNSHSIDRANVRQSKTGRPVRFELTEGTRQAVSIVQGDEGPLVAAALFCCSFSKNCLASRVSRLLSFSYASTLPAAPATNDKARQR